MPFDPWQEWAVIHGGELLPDGRPRFRVVLILVSRQNGKTHIPKLLTLHWLYVDRYPLVLGVSSKAEYAKEVWTASINIAKGVPELAAEIATVRTANGQEAFELASGPRAKISAANGDAGRSLSIDRPYVDELRQHHTYEAWAAIESTMNARPNAQAWLLSNAGSDASVVLNDLRAAALSGVDERLGIFEWSADDNADPMDLAALAQANPNLGRRLDADTLLSGARRAVELGGEALTTFKTENMCIRVKVLNPAIDPGAWQRCLSLGDLSAVRSRVALCLDVAPDQLHASLYAAAVLDDGRVRVDFVRDWSGVGCTDQLRRDLPGEVAKVKPKALGWLPAGPAAALAAGMAKRAGWPPPGVAIEDITGDLPAVAMGFAELVSARKVAHSGDPLLDAHVAAAQRLARGDRWVFSRKGGGHIDAAYAAAGAAHIAQTLPAPVGKPRLIT